MLDGKVVLVTGASRGIGRAIALTLGSAAGRALSLFPRQAGTASALIGVMQMSGASLLVFITQFLNLTTPLLIGLHFLLLVPFTYFAFINHRIS